MATSFSAPVTYATPGQNAHVAVADLNGDGLADLIVGSTAGISVLLGTGGGQFAAATSTSTPEPVVSIATGDLNGDGIPDLVEAQENPTTETARLAILLGNGKGGFDAPSYTSLPYLGFPVPYGTYPVSLADLNNDGRPDLIDTGPYGGEVVLGDGKGGFGAPISLPAGLWPVQVQPANLNGDGNPDLVVVTGPDGITDLLGDGTGAFTPGRLGTSDGYRGPIAVGDFNGDGATDVVAFGGNWRLEGLTPYYGNGQGSFTQAANFAAPTLGGPIAMAAADLNADGRADIVAAQAVGGLLIYTTNSDATLSAALSEPTPDAPYSLTLADIDNDGKPDILLANASGGVSVYLNTTQPDTLVLRLSEDAWKGDAQFTVSVDGSQYGGIYTVDALHAAGLSENFTLSGDWGPAALNVDIAFINDAWGGTKLEDRNLYVDSIAYDGTSYAGTTDLLAHPQSQAFTIGGATPTTANPTATLTISLSEDAWKGDAQFNLVMDGKQIALGQAVTAQHAQGSWQTFTYTGDFATPGTHDVAITFINDAFGGKAGMDRNLYVQYGGISINGAVGFNDSIGTTTANINLTHAGTFDATVILPN